MSLWLLLQIADSAFPVGGFAHSGGLEAAVQLGEVKGAEGARQFVEQALWQAGMGALPFVRAAHEAFSGWRTQAVFDGASAVPYPAELRAHDALCHAFLSNEVANRASRTQGRTFLATCAEVFPVAAIAELDSAVRRREILAHHAPIFGAIAGALEIPREEALRLYLHLTLRGVVSAAVRLGVLGPLEAQRIQYSLTGCLEEVLSACQGLPLSEIAQPAPLLDLFQSLHGRLYARLFLS